MNEPLLPNALLVARREYVERVRSRAFAIATGFLILVAIGITMAPIGLKAVDRASVARIAVYAEEAKLTSTALVLLDQSLNRPPPGEDASRWEKRYIVTPVSDRAAAVADVQAGRLTGLLIITRSAEGGLAFTWDTVSLGSAGVTPVVLFGAEALSLLDWADVVRGQPGVGDYHPPTIQTENVGFATEGGQPIDEQLQASRVFLAILFVMLIFVTLLVYPIWVASSVASEKGSRVMELLISAASPLQLMVGKVAGMGLAGLTQYVAILVPALLVVAFQGRIAGFVLGASASTGAPLAGVTLPLLLAYGMFFALGFTFYALLYAAAGSIVSGLEDLQLLTLPMSFVPFIGTISTILALGSMSAPIVVALSYVPFFSPFVMLGRLLVGRVEPWELAACVGILVASIVIAAVFAARVYRAGVLMYGRRPDIAAFIEAARTAR